jgi:hypothetical protein
LKASHLVSDARALETAACKSAKSATFETVGRQPCRQESPTAVAISVSIMKFNPTLANVLRGQVLKMH